MIAIIPSLRDDFAQPVQPILMSSLTYAYINVVNSDEVEDSRLDGWVDGLEAIRQAVFHIVSTERYDYPIYPSNYGIEMRQFIGKSYNYFKAKINQVMTDALYQDDRIVSVTNISMSHPDPYTVYSEWEIRANRGAFIYGFQIPLSRN